MLLLFAIHHNMISLYLSLIIYHCYIFDVRNFFQKAQTFFKIFLSHKLISYKTIFSEYNYNFYLFFIFTIVFFMLHHSYESQLILNVKLLLYFNCIFKLNIIWSIAIYKNQI